MRLLHNKHNKLDTIERLIDIHEKQSKPDKEYLKDLRRRANELRVQLAVTSTYDPNRLQ
jgi:hypothetical protein